eukprot:s868_g19.t1
MALKLWRPLMEGTPIVVVLADEAQKYRLSQCSNDLMQVLELPSCKGLETQWPFSASLSWLLRQLGQPSKEPLYVCHGRLHAVGIGPNKQTRQRAAYLALALAALLQKGQPSWLTGELLEEFQLAERTAILPLDVPSGMDCSQDDPFADDGSGSSQVIGNTNSLELPQSGTWVWWLGHKPRGTPVVLCEDSSVGVFQHCKTWLREATNLSSWPEDFCERQVPKGWQDQLEGLFPDIYCLGLWKLIHEKEQWQVVAVGRDLEERRKAACVGLAAQITTWSRQCPWAAVQAEFEQSGWLPSQELRRFYDMTAEGFWSNLAHWQETELSPTLPLTDFSAVQKMERKHLKVLRLTCQPALHRDLQANGGYAEINLTHSRRPWPAILKGHSQRQEIVGQGVIRFAIAADERKLDPHQQDAPLVFCLVKRVDGTTTTFSDLQRTEETFRQQCLPKDEYLAFRMAAGWEVKGRWEAFEKRVFVNLIREYKEQQKIQQLGPEDLIPPTTGNRPQEFAWRLSDHVQRSFQQWLITRKACPKVDHLRSVTPPELRQGLDEAIAGVCRQSQSEPPPGRDTPGDFTPLQRMMLNAILDGDEWKRHLKDLDPSRWEKDYWRVEAEYAEQLQWISAGSDIRFSHKSISPTFLHGQHDRQPLHKTIQQLVDGPIWAESVPALVAVRFQRKIYVIFGNRRLYCFKEAYKQRSTDLQLKVRQVNAAQPAGSGSAAARQGVPPPPPAAAYPWPEEGVEGLDLPRLKLQQRPNPAEQAQSKPEVDVFQEEDAGTKKFRKRLSVAVDKGSTEEVEALLLDAQKVGMQGPEVRWARDTLLAAEAAEFRKNTVRQDAIESMDLDYWKLQAAMQAVIGCGLGKDQAPRLKQAMRTHKIRSEAARELRKAAQARDKARLRTAIEGALKA